MYAAASQKINSLFRRRRTHIAQSAAKSSCATENRFLPNVFKKFPAHIHENTFGRNGVIRYFRNGGVFLLRNFSLR